MFNYSGFGALETIYDAQDLASQARKNFNLTILAGGVVLLGSAGYYVRKHK